ncbi:putative zinc-binding protein [Clostridioides difficile]|nr:putative zinc-binding protein [Clostridioides difficile]MDI3004295.1 putative zinc-binding protein [Clostridioides difficile]
MENKIGIISCSGEECFGGTATRIATRKILETIKSDESVTICLPLFLAGGEEERNFAKEYPTISVDGCNKLCAKRGTEKHSGYVSGSIVASDIIGEDLALSNVTSLRDLKEEHNKAIDDLVIEIDKQITNILLK